MAKHTLSTRVQCGVSEQSTKEEEARPRSATAESERALCLPLAIMISQART